MPSIAELHMECVCTFNGFIDKFIRLAYRVAELERSLSESEERCVCLQKRIVEITINNKVVKK